jgi:hypothetical protein
MNGSVKHQAKPKCQTSSGTAHAVPALDGCNNFLHGFKGTHSAGRQAVRPAAVDRGMDARPPAGEAKRSGGTVLCRQGGGGDSPTPGTAACRSLWAGKPPVAARRPASPLPARNQFPLQRCPAVAPARAGRAVLHAPGILSPREGHTQGRSGLRPPRRLLRNRRPLGVTFHGTTRHLSGGPGEDRSC